MSRVEKTVFICYRRTNAAWTLAIFQYLTYRGYDVFYDLAGLGAGEFEPIILENVRTRAHFLVLLTPSALERCKEPEDWLRREIEMALDCGRNVVPVLLDRFQFDLPGVAEQLTGKLAALRSKQALTVYAEYFNAAMESLTTKFLNVSVPSAPHPLSPAVQNAALEQQAKARAAPPVTQEELTAEEWFERAFQSNDPAQQIRFYSRAIELRPDFAAALHNRGVARDSIGDFEGAVRDYSEAIQFKPDHAVAFSSRGLMRAKSGDPAGAIADLDEAIRLKPDLVDAFYTRGILRSEKGDVEGAIRDYGEAVRLKPDHSDAFVRRGMANAQKGDFESAIRDYDEAIHLRPEYVYALHERGVARKHKGDLVGAKKDLDEAQRLGWKEL